MPKLRYSKKNEFHYIYQKTWLAQVHVKFSRSFYRDKLLKASQENELMIKGNKIKILKYVLWKVRSRREYDRLAKFLKENEIRIPVSVTEIQHKLSNETF